MIWHYHNAAGLLLVAGVPYSASFAPSFLPFFQPPRAVFCASTHTFLGWWGGAQSPPIRHLSATNCCASPSSFNRSAAITPSPPLYHPPPPLELWGSIHEKACKGSADATRLSTFFERGSSSSRWTSLRMTGIVVTNYLCTAHNQTTIVLF